MPAAMVICVTSSVIASTDSLNDSERVSAVRSSENDRRSGGVISGMYSLTGNAFMPFSFGRTGCAVISKTLLFLSVIHVVVLVRPICRVFSTLRSSLVISMITVGELSPSILPAVRV